MNNVVTTRRATDHARERWQSAVREQRLPRLNDLRAAPQDEQWQNQFILRCDSDVPLSVFIFCGRRAQSALGLGRFGETLQGALPAGIRERVYQACSEALQHQQPSALEGAYEADGSEVLFRSIFLPILGADGQGAAAYLFGAFSCNLPFAQPTVH